MTTRLTRFQMAQQLREEAQELIRLAIELEGSHSQVQPETVRHISRKQELTIDDVIDAMGGKMRRKQYIADELGVVISVLDELMTRENGFVMNDKGWWKYNGPTSNT
jgi:hypothetical protein